MANVPWSDGPPSESELENWLVTTRNLTREEAREIASVYARVSVAQRNPLRSDVVGAASEQAATEPRPWTRASLTVWVDDMVTATQDRGEAPEGYGPRGDYQGPERGEGPEINLGGGGAGDFSAVAEQAREMAARRSQRQGQAQIIGDAGPAFDPAQLANSLALGGQVDPETGESYGISENEVWAQIKGLSFDMGNLNLPFTQDRYGGLGSQAKRPRSIRDRSIRGTEGDVESERRNQRSANAQAGRYARDPGARFRGSGRRNSGRMTPTQALAMLGSMSEDQLISLQRELFDAGFYGEEPPSWGAADTVTRRALLNMFVEVAQRDPDKPISRVLDELQAERIARMGPPESGPGSAGQQQLLELPDFSPEVTSAETLSGMIDDIAQDLRGEFASPGEKEALIAKLQQKEIGVQRTNYDRQVANAREQAHANFAFGPSGGQGAAGGGEIDRFMNAIAGRESGGTADPYTAQNPSGAYGRFQIMPANWAPWATRAGLGPNAPRTPQNQELVARRIMMDYYQTFGNWRDVAIAWFAGPGAVGDPSALRRSDGNMTVQAYANDVLNRMGAITQGDPMAQSGIVEVGGQQYPAIETFDPASEAEAILKAADPAAWEASEWGDRAIQFYDLLGGVV